MDNQKQRVWQFLFFVLLAVVLVDAAIRVYRSGFEGSSSKSDNAVAYSLTLIRACEAYRKHPIGDGKYPATLTELVDPDPKLGRKPLIDGGRAAIFDPWNKQDRYAVVETETGPVPHVWSEHEYDGKLRIFGARLSADGKAQSFGVSE